MRQRHGSGYLSCHNLHAFRSFYYYGGTLVVGAGFGQPGFHELPVLCHTFFTVPSTGYQLACTLTRLMNIDTMIRRSWKYSFSSTSSTTTILPSAGATTTFSVSCPNKRMGAAEEVHEYAIYYEADDRYYVKRNFAFQSEVKGSVDSQNQNQAACQCMCSFTVYAYLF